MPNFWEFKPGLIVLKNSNLAFTNIAMVTILFTKRFFPNLLCEELFCFSYITF